MTHMSHFSRSAVTYSTGEHHIKNAFLVSVLSFSTAVLQISAQDVTARVEERASRRRAAADVDENHTAIPKSASRGCTKHFISKHNGILLDNSYKHLQRKP